MKRLILVVLALLGPAASAGAESEVRAADYDAYWLWAGVRSRPGLEAAKTLYLLQGEIAEDASGAVRLRAQGATEPGPHRPRLWLVYRVRSLAWRPEVVAGVRRRFALWRAQPGDVAGVQVDFDASTRGLQQYTAFLRELRSALPPDCALSVTGLMDWASQARPEDIDALAGSVDELVFQTYRGRETVPDIDAYVARLKRLHTPFRLGLAEGAQWRSADALAAHPYFRGYVVFLRNQH
ncbi:DUF3142 domain-containing protein [Methylocystis heyeri]|uniref:DUF3142 domain-containing protein n=1 Tax=Methylocystis heyeri TaxID=391905 RepID=A0A6B8KD33_9HYPH|nr:DUF3142 domain-containing protein [Methylocystis heyeri]QGM46324.1 DUF3142 domain-containing protein [Methylocystis heyeri]